MTLRVIGSQTTTGPSTATFIPGATRFNVMTWGDFAGTYVIERSLNGTNWGPLTNVGDIVTFSGFVNESMEERGTTAQYRLNVLTRTGGTLYWGFGP